MDNQYKDTPEILELIKRAQTGDSRAENKLVLIYQPYVEYMVYRYSKKTCIDDDDDLRSCINIGLIEGIRKFDPSRNTLFIYFAHIWMKKQIFLEESDFSLIRIPVNQKIFYDDFTREHSKDDLKSFDISDKDLRRYMVINNAGFKLFSEFDTVEDDHGEVPYLAHHIIFSDYIKEQEEKENRLCIESLKRNINRVLKHFNDKEVYIIEHLFGLNGAKKISSDQIAHNLNVTKVNITFTKTRVIRMMRHSSISNMLLNGI